MIAMEWGSVADACRDYIREHGPSTACEVVAGTGLRDRSVRNALWQAIKDRPLQPQSLHVKEWRHTVKADGTRYPRAVYAFGIGVNAPRPAPIEGRVRNKQYKKRRQDAARLARESSEKRQRASMRQTLATIERARQQPATVWSLLP